MIVIGKIKEVYNDSTLPSIKDAVNELTRDKKHIILTYLKSGKVVGSAPAIARDVLTGEKISNGLEMRSDGEFAWRSDVVYYFEKYNLDLGVDFIEHVMKKTIKS